MARLSCLSQRTRLPAPPIFWPRAFSPACSPVSRPKLWGRSRTGRGGHRGASRLTSHAAVSRRFVTATAERLSELLGRRLDDRRYLVLMLDAGTWASTSSWEPWALTPRATRCLWESPRARPRTQRSWPRSWPICATEVSMCPGRLFVVDAVPPSARPSAPSSAWRCSPPLPSPQGEKCP